MGRVRFDRCAPVPAVVVGLVAAFAAGLTACGSGGGGGGGSGAPSADFRATGRVGDSPLLVTFTDDSTGAITSWSWDFGDGTSSSEASPSHTYTTPATCSVALTVTGPGGSASRTRPGLVRVFDGNLSGLWTSPREL